MGSFIGRIFRFLGFASKPAKSPNAIRIGILGAATIAPPALIWPALYNPNVIIAAVAARDSTRAMAFAKKHHIPRFFSSYEELLAQQDIDAVYIPSPNGLHFKWACAALRAGKHVLCEKPITSNAEEAEALLHCAKECNRLVMEASHSFYHPALIRAREIVRSGELGVIQSVEASFKIPLIPKSDIRYNVNGTQPQLAGGAFMDTGVYTANCVRFLTDLNFLRCVRATATEAFPGVDSAMDAVLEFENSPVVGKVSCSLALPFPFLPQIHARVQGSFGSLELSNFVMPTLYHSITVVSLLKKKKRVEKHYGSQGKSTYEYQLENFVDFIRTFQNGQGGFAAQVGDSNSTLNDPVNTMRLVDGVYEASGLHKRSGLVAF
jgi:predicted dehydrogenase